MALRQLKDGRWVCYYRSDGRLKFEYFGRGAEAEAKAWVRQNELNPQKRRHPRPNFWPLFIDLFKEYPSYKVFINNPPARLIVR